MADALTKYRDTAYPLGTLVSEVGRGSISLPNLQRPFVWHNRQVRNLFDSLYQGFPVGQVMFWETGVDIDTRTIGGAKDAPPRLVIVDGQQRLTAAYAVMTGTPVVDEKYRTRHLRLAFRPADRQFWVPTAATLNDPEFLNDITEVYTATGTRRLVNDFLGGVEKSRGSLSDEDAEALANAIDRLAALKQFPMQAVELNANIDEDEAAEVFVRINSEGTDLDQADFLLTLMSVHARQERHQLEEFARNATVPASSGTSPFNHLIQPGPDQMVRVVVAVAFRRGRLKSAYQVLRGKDPETGESSNEQRDANLERLRQAQGRVLDLHRWHEFLHCIEAAGYRSAKQISSQFAVLATYSLWQMGRERQVGSRQLQNVMARWFFFSQVTGRYSGSSESQFDKDLRMADESAGPDGFVASLEGVLSTQMSQDFFESRLPRELDARSWRNRALTAYEAALVVLDAPMLFSPTGETVASRLDPAVRTVKSVERHHLFPKAWVRRTYDVSGHALNGRADRPANASWVDWIENNEISDTPPADYWEEHAARLSDEELVRQMRLHALPAGWHLMDYDKFLDERRTLMAEVVAEGYLRLKDRMPPQ